MQIEKKYEQWKAITESDFVTLFIKTWFTYIAVLRELNPDVNVFTEDGLPRGDKPFLNAFRDGIMPIIQKHISVDSIAQELFRMYPISMKKVIDVFPQYFFQTFFRINESFNYSERLIEKDTNDKVKERYEANFRITNRYCIKMYLGVSGRFRSTSYNEQIKKEIDLRDIIESNVNKYRMLNLNIDETQFMRDFYDEVMDKIADILRRYMDEILPAKGYNQTVSSKIRDACLRLRSDLRIRFEYNYKFPHEVSALVAPNSYAIIFQCPFNGFGKVELDNIYTTYKDDYLQLIATKGVDWFASYVYSLRNALFHEIISPLDEEWQMIFKSAYLILKQISDVCISYITQIDDFPKMEENVVFEYIEKYQDSVFAHLADSVELLKLKKMTLNNWKIEQGRITLNGWFLAKLKLQMGSAEDCIIEEQDKGFDFSTTLNDDFSIAYDYENQTDLIAIKLQGDKSY